MKHSSSDNARRVSATASKSHALKGDVKVPGDKSISHRSLMIASQAIGRSSISGLLEGEDVLRTADALCALGVQIERDEHAVWHVQGVGVGGLREPDSVLDLGNSGTAIRLLMGLVAPYSHVTTFTGDASLRKRPMQRVIAPLSEMGVTFMSREGGRLPLAMRGTRDAIAITYELPVPSAQVKSAILFAGLNTRGSTTVIEREATRDHTERMLRAAGAEINVCVRDDRAHEITLKSYPSLKPMQWQVPGDPSSAAFLVCAASLIAGSHIFIRDICINPLRVGLFTTLIEMGANITYLNKREVAGEEVADLEIRASTLNAIEVPAERAPSMIDEYPILAIAAASAKGTTRMNGIAELKVKESNRLQAVADGLIACGVNIKMGDDWLEIKGNPDHIPGNATITTHMDHRIAMAFLVMGMIAKSPVTVDDIGMIATSFPRFIPLMQQLGAQIETRQ